MLNLNFQLWGFGGPVGAGKIWYVTATDSGGVGTGTFADPWQTFLNIDETVIEPGHTLDGMGDTYVDTLTFGKSGISGKPIKIRNITATEITSPFDYLTIYNCTGLIDIDGDNCILYGNTGSIEVAGLDNIVWKNTSTITDTGTNTRIWYNICESSVYGIDSAGVNPDIQFNYCDTNTEFDISCHGSGVAEIGFNVCVSTETSFGSKSMNVDGMAANIINNICINHNEAFNTGISIVNTTATSYSITLQNNIVAGESVDVSLYADASSALIVTGGGNCLVNDSSVATSGSITYTGSENDLYQTDPLLTLTYRLDPLSPCLNAGVDVGETQAITPESVWPNGVILNDYNCNVITHGTSFGPDTIIWPCGIPEIHIGPWVSAYTG